MFRLHHDCYAGRFEACHERLCNLRGEIFLDLQTTRKDIDNARDLGKPNHLSIRNVSDMRPSGERKKMMLTERIEFDVFDQNDLARIRLKNGIVDDFVEVLSVTLRQKFQGARRAIRSAPQTFSVQVLAKAIKQVAIC